MKIRKMKTETRDKQKKKAKERNKKGYEKKVILYDMYITSETAPYPICNQHKKFWNLVPFLLSGTQKEGVYSICVFSFFNEI
jgi:hypothetical protein